MEADACQETLLSEWQNLIPVTTVPLLAPSETHTEFPHHNRELENRYRRQTSITLLIAAMVSYKEMALGDADTNIDPVVFREGQAQPTLGQRQR